jgi:beta-lactamase regulating signal transducer with metallopeptidase domain
MNPESLLPLLLDLGMKSVFVILAAILADLAWRRASAANRHAIWLTLLATLLLLPLTEFADPHWTFFWRGLAKPQPALTTLLPIDSHLELPAFSPASAILAKSTLPQFPMLRWTMLGVMAWAGGAALLLFHRAAMNWKLRRFVRGSLKTSDERMLALARESARGVGAPWELRESDLCRAPLVFGMRRPVILLPMEAQGWTGERLSAVLLHEFGHVRRGDCRTRLLMDIACAVYWVNPLVWIASRKMRIAQEQACDDIVLSAGVSATDYASQLVEIVRSLASDRFRTRHALAMAQPSTLETRVRAIVDLNCDRRPLSRAALAGGSLAIMAALALCGVAQLRGADGKTDVPPSASKGSESKTEITSDTLLSDKEKGTLTASGNTTIKTADMIVTADKPVVNQIVATVNNQSITEAEVTQATHAADRGSAETRKATIEKLIDRALLLQAIKKMGYVPFPDILQERVKMVVDQEFGGDQAKFEAVLAKQGYTLESFKKKEEEDILATEMRRYLERSVIGKDAKKQAVDTWLAAARAKAKITYN